MDIIISYIVSRSYVAIHNFPEGLATFAAAVQDPAAGAVFAVAVVILYVIL
jgi:ZIP family zinc transporter